ncbi:MAG: DUF177 domain-containing protein [Chitinophagaceae bacterium]|jgi:uncharacterized metal-binding protein YceD (DUF177 family)|nr:DUF177 domain-containing protein [Chitinophagaceae bacterium]
MNYRKGFDIAFVGLKPGIHTFEYSINDKFFEPYGKQDFSNCEAKIILTLEKNNSFMFLKFDIDGKVDSFCDRCGNRIPVQLWDEFNIVVKMIDNPDAMNEQEDDPDVYYISHTESHLHIADWIYEFVNLSIPLQKQCGEEGGTSLCNQEVLDKLQQMKNGNTFEPDELKLVWKGLDRFRNLENLE